MRKISFIIFSVLICSNIILGQFIEPVPKDPAGDKANTREGIMAGNRVLLLVNNTTELGDRTDKNPSRISYWPNNYAGTGSHDCIWLHVGTRIFVDTTKMPGQDGYVVESVEEAANTPDVDTLYYVQSHTREVHDGPPAGGIQWGFYPVKGYFNPLSEIPAMADKIGTQKYRDSWPDEGWPAVTDDGRDTLIYKSENGEVAWNGRFGKNVFKADLECYFVANDAQDLEKIEEPRFEGRRYYPLQESGLKIGDRDPNVSIQNGKPWGGIGVRAAVRGYQWTNPQAQDAIFFEYNINNFSDYQLPSVYLGFEVDNAVGGESGGTPAADDVAYYKIEHEVNLCFVWDWDFVPVGGGKEPGVIGFAFLESPGINDNGIDDDKDGIIDESRTNTTTASSEKVHYTQILDNVQDYKEYNDLDNISEEDFIRTIGGEYHYPQDEDLDWRPFDDDNGNGQWDPGENINDDVGTDGLGPYDLLFYDGPDANGTEANGRPDCIPGLGSEPNFGTTDVSETDQLGLQNFKYVAGSMPVYTGWGCEPGYGVCADENCYKLNYDGITATNPDQKYDKAQQEPLNFHHHFSSGMIEMEPGRTERISIAELHAYDPLAGLRGANPKAPALFRKTEVVNSIYEADYRFAQPPIMPNLTAIPSDGKVTLKWDDKSEKFTREVMLKNRNDFEGYKLYRATDKQMSDPDLITDLNGNFVFKKPIFQCDTIDGKLGPVDFGLLNGTGYNLGDDTGLRHSFVDTTVNNGQTYYYVLVAYDYGLPEVGDGVSPSENIFVIEKDQAENITAISKNVAIVTPHQHAAGYVPPEIVEFEDSTIGTGYVIPEVLDREDVMADNSYKVKFKTETISHDNVAIAKRYWNSGLEVYNTTKDQLVYREGPGKNPSGNIIKYIYDDMISYGYRPGTEMKSDIFEGLVLNYYFPVIEPKIDTAGSGWRTGSGAINIIGPEQHRAYLPYDYEIIFSDNTSDKIIDVSSGSITNAANKEISADNLLFDANLPFYVRINTFAGTQDALTSLVVHDKNDNGQFDYDTDPILVGVPEDNNSSWGALAFEIDMSSRSNLPGNGDSYFVTFNRGFTEEDEITFTVKPEEELNKDKVEEDMDQIKVVPNPYICTNELEPSVMNTNFNQRRRILFTNVPAKCNIKIFSITGVLVDEIKVNHSKANATELSPDSEANGVAIWDVKTREGLEVAAGYYLYRVESQITGDEKVGKFAIIK